MDRAPLASWWDDAWKEGLWAAPWGRAIADLSPAQASWKPAPGRHSIWQIVTHIIFWRESELGLLAGKPRPRPERIAAEQFAEPSEPTDAAWAATRERLADSQRRLSEAFRDPSSDLKRASYLLPHDCYHFGQVCYIRALQGLPPIE
jgi:hypothetical protein